MKFSIAKDNKRRQLFFKHELTRLVFKSLLQNFSLPRIFRTKLQLQLTLLPRDSSLVRIQNRCILTGRSKGVYKFFKLSRIQIRELAAQGKIMGLQKSSW